MTFTTIYEKANVNVQTTKETSVEIDIPDFAQFTRLEFDISNMSDQVQIDDQNVLTGGVEHFENNEWVTRSWFTVNAAPTSIGRDGLPDTKSVSIRDIPPGTGRKIRILWQTSTRNVGIGVKLGIE